MEKVEELLRKAKYEVETLRRQNEILRAKVDTMELMATLLHTQAAYRSQGETIDIVWEIQKQLNTWEAEAHKQKSAADATAAFVARQVEEEVDHLKKVER